MDKVFCWNGNKLYVGMAVPNFFPAEVPNAGQSDIMGLMIEQGVNEISVRTAEALGWQFS